jgi:excinuclease UvrABC ATPase subunit
MEKPAEPIQKWDVSDKRRAAMRESKLGDKNPMKDPAVRKKVSEALKGRKKSPEAEAKRLKSREGFKHSEESKQKIQTALKGKAKTEEHKKQMSKSKLGHKRSQESINKQIEKRKGIPLSEEVKQKMRKPKSKLTCPHCQQVGGSSQMKRWHFENCKNKI